jgi:hypothetical protein
MADPEVVEESKRILHGKAPDIPHARVLCEDPLVYTIDDFLVCNTPCGSGNGLPPESHAVCKSDGYARRRAAQSATT